MDRANGHAPTSDRAPDEFAAVANKRPTRNESVQQRAAALGRINEQFNIGQSVRHLQDMMHQVTEKEVTAENVTAACGCVRELNSTIHTVIMAAKFLSEK